MPAVMLAQVIFRHVSGLPEDVSVNTFHFSTADGSIGSSHVVEAAARIEAGYNLQTAGLKILDVLGGQLNGTWHVKGFDLGDSTPRVPKADLELVAFTPSGTSLPAEVALCVSYQATPQSGNPQASRRNRVFLGPLGVTVNAANASDVASRPTLAAKNTAIQGIKKLNTAVNGATNLQWVVYSEKLQAFAAVHDLWVDDAFDTQRRRGEAPTSRVTALA